MNEFNTKRELKNSKVYLCTGISQKGNEYSYLEIVSENKALGKNEHKIFVDDQAILKLLDAYEIL